MKDTKRHLNQQKQQQCYDGYVVISISICNGINEFRTPVGLLIEDLIIVAVVVDWELFIVCKRLDQQREDENGDDKSELVFYLETRICLFHVWLFGLLSLKQPEKCYYNMII